MQFDIFATMQQRDLSMTSQEIVRIAVEQTKVAEELGFRTAWYPEHHFSNYSLCPSPLVMAAYCAGVTKKIRLGTGVLILPLYTPARLLAEIGLVDGLSEGRLEIGIGAGYQKFEFDRFATELSHNKQTTIEMLDILETGLSQPIFQYDGQYLHQPPTAISARSVQKPHPPITVATFDPALIRRGIEGGHGLFMTGWLGGSKRLGGIRKDINEICASVGRDPGTVRTGLLRFGFTSENRRDVEHYVDCARYQQRLGNMLKFRRETLAEGYVVEERPYDDELPFEKMMANIPVGDPETCAERMVNDIRALRPDHVALHTQIGDINPRVMLKSMETWMTKVVPMIDKALANDNLPASATSAAD